MSEEFPMDDPDLIRGEMDGKPVLWDNITHVPWTLSLNETANIDIYKTALDYRKKIMNLP